MNTAIRELPAGAAREHQIEEIEAYTQDAQIRRVIANDPKPVLVPLPEVFAESRARLMAKLASQSNG